MLARLAADGLVLVHLAFILFVVFGGFLAWRWRRLVWIHVPCALWGAIVEFAGWICPLTPLENRLRRAAGQSGYEGGFVEHYVMPVLYPDVLTRELQIAIGLFALVTNVAIYAWVLHRRRAVSKDTAR